MSLNSGSRLLARINFIFVILFVLLLPFNDRFISYLIIPWTIVSVVLAVIKRIKMKEILKTSLLFLIYYLISLISLVYTKDLKYGIENLETLASFIVMPFLLLMLRTVLLKEKIKYLTNMYIIGLVIYIIITLTIFFTENDLRSLINSLGTYSFTDDARYYKLSYIQHESYISMYLIWGIILIVNRLFQRNNVKYYILEIFLVIIFALYIILLGSRAALLTLLVITTYYLWKLLSKLPYWISIIFTSAILVLLIVGMLKYTRIGDVMSKNVKNPTTEIRISLWSDAFAVFKDAPLFGHGIGDEVNKMIDKHYENGNTKAGMLRLNAHNQYLETATQTGLVGLVSLFAILLIPLIISIRDRYELLFLFIVIIFINFFFESMLVRLAGVLFLVFWLNFLLLIHFDSESKINFSPNSQL